MNSVDDLLPEHLGWADTVYQETLGEEKFTFVEGCKNPKSCTVLIKGPDEHTVAMLKDAVHDGLRAVRNAITDGKVLPGAGAFEIFLHSKLMEYKDQVIGKEKLAVASFAEALLIVPKVLAENSGFDVQDAVIMLIDEYKKK